MHTEKRNKPGGYAIYSLISLALLCAFASGCRENEFPQAQEKAGDPYTLRLSTSGLSAGERQQLSSLDAYVFRRNILKEIKLDIPVQSDGTIKILGVSKGDKAYFVSNSKANGLYAQAFPGIGKISEATFIGYETPIIDPGKEKPLLFYSGGPLVIGYTDILNLARSLVQINLKIEDNAKIKVTKIDFGKRELSTYFFPDLSPKYSNNGKGYYEASFDPPVGTMENIQQLYRRPYSEGNNDKDLNNNWIFIHALYGDSEEFVILHASLPPVMENNHIYTLLVKDAGSTALATVEGATSLPGWEEGKTENSLNEPIWTYSGTMPGNSYTCNGGYSYFTGFATEDAVWDADTLKVVGASGTSYAGIGCIGYSTMSISDFSPKIKHAAVRPLYYRFTDDDDMSAYRYQLTYSDMEEHEFGYFNINATLYGNWGTTFAVKKFYVKRDDSAEILHKPKEKCKK